jgi:hypothetical protein
MTHPVLAASEPMRPADAAAWVESGLAPGWLAIARRGLVLNDGEGRFQLHPLGKPRWLLPVLADIDQQWSPQPLASTIAGNLVLDVVAIGRSPRIAPLLADGMVDFFGNLPGDVALPIAEATPPLRVFASLHALLARPAGAGIALLGDNTRAHRTILRDSFGGVVADSPAHGRKLLDLMRDAPPTLPPILVEQPEAVAA